MSDFPLHISSREPFWVLYAPSVCLVASIGVLSCCSIALLSFGGRQNGEDERGALMQFKCFFFVGRYVEERERGGIKKEARTMALVGP